MLNHQLRRRHRKKYRLGYPCMFIALVTLTVAAMIVNVMMAKHHALRRSSNDNNVDNNNNNVDNNNIPSSSSSSLESQNALKEQIIAMAASESLLQKNQNDNNHNNNNNNNNPENVELQDKINHPQDEEIIIIDPNEGGEEDGADPVQIPQTDMPADGHPDNVIQNIENSNNDADIHGGSGGDGNDNDAADAAAADAAADQSEDQHSKVHVVFSTSCHVKQDWQSYVFFYQAMIHKQQGTVTRIVSGCDAEQEAAMINIFEEQISIMSDNFYLYFTPEFGRVPGRNYQETKYWNKPFGFRHWLEGTFGYNYTTGKMSSPEYDDDVVILVDPDMLIQRPFVNHFPPYLEDLWIPPIRNGADPIYERVSHGKPMAQEYSFNDAWLRSASANLTHVVGPDSPVHQLSASDARTYYPAGPPYIATARDMYQIAYHWTLFLPRIFDLFPKFMSEMYGYCMAAAHLGLKHQIAQGFMVSNVHMTGAEGWAFLRDSDSATVCDVKQFGENVPHVIHFCQRYSIGEYFLSKYKLPVDILSCDFPLLELPPLDVAAQVDYGHYGDGSVMHYDAETNKNLKNRNTYMVCNLMPAINNAARFYKDHHCPNGANYNETWNTFKTEVPIKKK